MASREEEIILKLEVDQSGAEKELARVEKSILDNRQAIQDLNKAYKAGEKSQEDYVKESLKLQSTMKQDQELKRNTIKLLETESNSRNAMRLKIGQLTKEYNNLNTTTKEGQKRAADLEKQLKKLNDTVNEGSKRAGNFKDNIGRYTESIVDASKQITIHGTNVGGLISTFKSFANPVTAVIAGITALTTVYAKSSVGARDYDSAINQLGFAFQAATNTYGNFIQRVTGGNENDPSNGPLSRIAEAINTILVGPGAARYAKFLAQQQERIVLIENAKIALQGEAKESERLAEIQRRIRDDESKSIPERLIAIKKINQELVRSGELRKIANLSLIDAIKYGTLDFSKNYVAVQKVTELQRENLDIGEEIEGKKTENLMAEKAILELQRTLSSNARRTRRDSPLQSNIQDLYSDPRDQTQKIKKVEKDLGKVVLDVRADVNTRLARQDAIRTEMEKEQGEIRLRNASNVADALAGLFRDGSNAQKILLSGATIINTYSAATAALAPPPTGLGPVAGIPLSFATIARGLANLAQINDIKFARGGYTGSGFGSPDSTGFKPAGIVHEHEYVAPKRVTMSAAAQPHIQALESMRLRKYADGGLVTNSSLRGSNEALAAADAYKNMPDVVLDLSETRKRLKTIEQRERVSRLNRRKK